jgi:Na+-translocating ferredoxin:NAD+ oxidoreductase RnfG subunit
MSIKPEQLFLLLGPVVAVQAFAEVYMTDEKAVQLIFPEQKFERKSISLLDSEMDTVKSAFGEKVRNQNLVVWVNGTKDCVFVDQVLGKHEFITYAVGIDHDGKVKGIEILEYRESYGHQVKREDWRKQFVGKTRHSALKLDDDIKNISGATLSSSHVTAGVKRLLITYDTIKKRL